MTSLAAVVIVIMPLMSAIFCSPYFRTAMPAVHSNPSGVFGLNWAGKQAAFTEATAPPKARLIAHPGYEDTHAAHTFIAGDNLEALKLLMPGYEGRIKVIFIDPPYNTSSDRFIYQDDFATAGNRHAAWLSMMAPRLILAKRLLREDGVIFISIGDDEVHHLALLMNEIFGEAHFVANLLWRRRKTQANLSKIISPVHDYILCYAKNKQLLRFNKIGYSAAFIKKTFSNPDNDPRGPYQTRPLAQPANSTNRAYTLILPGSRAITAKWSCSPETFERYIAEDMLYIPRGGKGMPRLKIFLSRLEGAIPNTWLDDVATYEEGSKEIERIFGSNAFFISPKPTALIRRLIGMSAGRDDIIMDFFAGSGSTAHTVALMNEADGGTRQSISVQLPEETAVDSLPHQQGYNTIADICRERISRVFHIINGTRATKGMPPESLRCYTLGP